MAVLKKFSSFLTVSTDVNFLVTVSYIYIPAHSSFQVSCWTLAWLCSKIQWEFVAIKSCQQLSTKLNHSNLAVIVVMAAVKMW